MNEHYIKIKKCIDSSKTELQFQSCENLIDNFSNKFCLKNYGDCSYAKILVKNLQNSLNHNKNKFLESMF